MEHYDLTQEAFMSSLSICRDEPTHALKADDNACISRFIHQFNTPTTQLVFNFQKTV